MDKFTRKNFKAIEAEAYLLWESAGKPEGMSEFLWLIAKDRVWARGKISDLTERVDAEQRRGLLSRLGVYG